MENLPRFRPGDKLKASDLDAIARANEANHISGPGVHRTPSGTVIEDGSPRAIFARIVAHLGSGVYSWHQVVVRVSDGTWIDGDLEGVTAETGARDLNASTTLAAGKRVYLRPFPGGGWWFQGAC